MRISLTLLLLALALPLGTSSPDTASRPPSATPPDPAPWPSSATPPGTAPRSWSATPPRSSSSTLAATPPRPSFSGPAVTAPWPSSSGPAGTAPRSSASGPGGAGRQFLLFDPRGDGRAVEALGDLATADRIAVLVPGVSTRLRDFDRGLGGVARRAPAVQARTVYAHLRAADLGARVAVVAWLGYDPPEGLSLDAGRDLRARSGAEELIAFVRTLPDRAAVTLIGHSYGALVVGLAAPHLPRVADVVALGAPGMGARTAAALGGTRVWSALAADDWIRRVPQLRIGHLGHGRRPSAAAFGALPLPTDGVNGHDGYLCPGSATLDAVTTIVLGRTLRTSS